LGFILNGSLACRNPLFQKVLQYGWNFSIEARGFFAKEKFHRIAVMVSECYRNSGRCAFLLHCAPIVPPVSGYMLFFTNSFPTCFMAAHESPVANGTQRAAANPSMNFFTDTFWFSAIGFWNDNSLSFRKLRAPYPAKRFFALSGLKGFPREIVSSDFMGLVFLNELSLLNLALTMVAFGTQPPILQRKRFSLTIL
jgi:hypothetical protein